MAGPFSTFSDEDLARFAAHFGAKVPAAPSAPAPSVPAPAVNDAPWAVPGARVDGGPAAPIDLGAQAFGPPVAPPAPPPEKAAFDWNNAFKALAAEGSAGDIARSGFGAPPPPPKAPAMPAPAPPPGGPTAADDAAFEQAKAQQAPSRPAQARPMTQARPGNPDPYGSKTAMKGLLGTYDAQMDATRRMHSAEADKAVFAGERMMELSRRREEDASINQLEAQSASEHFDARMTEIERQLDDVRAKKIDPNRLMRESPGMGLLAVIGGVVGGVYQGLTNGQENGFLRDLNRMIDRDIAAQERDMDNDQRHFGEKLNLLTQQRAVWKDTQLAKMQTQNLYYEAAKENIAAEGARYDTPIYQARSDEAIANIQRAQDELRLKIAQQLQSQAAAAGARDMARQKEVRDVFRETYDKALGAGLSPAQAEFEATRVVGVLYAPGNAPARGAMGAGPDPVSLVPKDQRTEAVKELQANANKGKVIGSIAQSFQTWRDTSTFSPAQLDSTRSAIAGTIMANVPGIRSDVDFKEIVEPNLPARLDTEETLRRKEATIKQFVESKTTTPILDAHAPGWRPKDVAYKDVK